MMHTKVKNTILRHRMLSSGDRVLVAVSGGPDSVCLLALLSDLSRELGISLHVAHLDHMFRGRQSAGEALFVSSLAQKMNLPATIEQFDVPSFCREHRLSAQAGARRIRYEFLARAARGAGASRIATGHTATDQAETFLLRLTRGAGAAGLSSIPPKRDVFIRPLIEATREEVLDYLAQKSLSYAVDPSNARPVYTRNRIRMELLPVLKKFNPRIVETLAAEAGLLRDDDQALDDRVRALSAEIVADRGENIAFRRSAFSEQPLAIRRRMLRKALAAAGADISQVSLLQLDEALAFVAAAQTGRAMNLPQGLTLSRAYDEFVIGRFAAAPGFSRSLAVPGITMLPEAGMNVECSISSRANPATENENNLWQAHFDYAKIGNSLGMRSRLPGDRFCPTGMGGRSRKLSDYLVDRKVPRSERDAVPLLVAGNNVLWVVGFRLDERFLAGPETGSVLTVRILSQQGGSEKCKEEA